MKRSLSMWGLGVLASVMAGPGLWAQENVPVRPPDAPPPAQERRVASLSLASVFSDHMVLQQGMPVPVWGTCRTGDTVTVEFAGQKKTVDADAEGRWRVQLDSLQASAEPCTLRVQSAKDGQHSVLTNILVGEVWIGSGQSNMEWPLSNTENATEAMAFANDPLLRLFTVRKATSDTAMNSVTGAWESCTTLTVSNFSAVAYYFGRDLRKARGVPVGVIVSAWGGTCAEAWTPAEALKPIPEFGAIMGRHQKAVKEWDPAKVEERFQQEVTNYQAAVTQADKEGKKRPRRPKRALSPAQSPHRPSCLYNAMIAPLQPFALRGVIWYQGEANVLHADEYANLFPALIKGWRDTWGLELPFLFVQIAPHKEMSPMIRDAQLQTWRRVPRTAMTVVTDYGNATNIHPRAKAPVGARLALAARALAYGEPLEYSGPAYESVKMDGGHAIVSFTHLGGGLVTAGTGLLKGFAMAGADRVFKPAEVTIEGNTVVVHCPSIVDPKAVRYGWENVPDVNLFNKAGLPASPFRTDNWDR